MIPRILTVLVTVPIIVACSYLGGASFFALVAVLVLISLNEFYNMQKMKGFNPYYTIGNIFAITIVIFAQFTLKHPNWEPVSSALLTLAVITCFSAGLLIRRSSLATANIAITLLGMLYVGWLFSYLVILRALTPHGAFLFYLLIVVWVLDMLAYFVGKTFGRRQLNQYISPKKTVEGAIAGFIGAVAASIAFGYAYEYVLSGFKIISVPQAWPHYLILGAIIGVLAQVSDLSESLLKRDAGVKDSSRLVPGHGGVLDRMDSFIFTAPIVYYYISWFLLK